MISLAVVRQMEMELRNDKFNRKFTWLYKFFPPESDGIFRGEKGSKARISDDGQATRTSSKAWQSEDADDEHRSGCQGDRGLT